LSQDDIFLSSTNNIVTLTYVAGAFVFELSGQAFWLAISGAVAHFLLTRLTDYPQGTIRRIPFKVHAYIELTEGITMLLLILALIPLPLTLIHLFLGLMGFSQLVAFSFSNYTLKPASSDL